MTREADVGIRRLSQSSSTSKPVERPASRRVSDSRLAGPSKEASHVAFAADSKGKGKAAPHDAIDEDDEEDESMHCAICLSVIDDRTVCDPCQHGGPCKLRLAPHILTIALQTRTASCASWRGPTRRDDVPYARRTFAS